MRLDTTAPALTDSLGRRAYKRAIRGLTKRSAIAPLLPFAQRSVDRVRLLDGPSNQRTRFASTSDAAEWALVLLGELRTYVDEGVAPRLPKREEIRRHVDGRPPPASAAIRAVVELCMAATARRAFDKLVIQAALSLVDSGEPRGAIETALHEVCRQ